MNNDLISRSELKKAIKNLYNETLDGIVKFGIEKAYKEIDNAPTVEYPFYQEASQTGYEEGKNSRPQGKWINDCYMEGNFYHTCNKCNMEIVETAFDNFCPNCGADMRKGEGND